MAGSPFRKEALDRLKSPEQLDQIPRVVPPMAWLGLTAIAGLLVVLTVWGFVGRIPQKVATTGMLIKHGGVYGIAPTAGGRVRDILVKPGDIVTNGQIVARVDQPNLLEELADAEARLDEARDSRRQRETFWNESIDVHGRDQAMRKAALLEANEASQRQLAWLEEKQRNQEELFNEGLITKDRLMTTQRQHAMLVDEIKQNSNAVHRMEVEAVRREQDRENELRSLAEKIESLDRERERHEAELRRTSTVCSPHEGRVVEISAGPGSTVTRGQDIIKLDPASEDCNHLEAVLFVPPAQGKKIQVGMRVQLTPASAGITEHGHMPATITDVSPYPATAEAMLRRLGNEALVRTLSGGNASVLVRAAPLSDPSTPSGLKWSSGRGPETKVASGTLCSAQIITREVRPVSYAVPLFRKVFLGKKEPFQDEEK